MRWDASEELSSFLDVVFADKPLSVYDRKQITKEFPRPNVESVFTPVFDGYLGSLVTGAKGVDKEAKKLQDQLLNIVGPLSMAFEYISSWQENEDDSGTITLPTQDVDGLYACLSKALTLLGSVNAQYKVQRKKQVLDKVNPQMSSLASEPFPDGGKNLLGPSFEEKVKKRNETVKILSKAAPHAVFSERDLLPIQARARGSISWKMVNSPTRLPNQREKLIFQGPGPEQGKVPSCSAKSELCCTPKFPVAVASQLKTGMLPVKENLNFPKVKSFLSSLGLSAVEADHLPIAGRLQFFVENWQVVANDPWVISAISGYHIPFTVIPHQGFLPSHKVSGEDGILIDKELGELIQKQAIHPVSEHDYNTGFVSNLFVIPKKGGGQRPVFNLRQLNQVITYEHFKMEGIRMLRDLLKPNDFMAKIDLKDTFLKFQFGKAIKSSSGFLGRVLSGSSHASHLE